MIIAFAFDFPWTMDSGPQVSFYGQFDKLAIRQYIHGLLHSWQDDCLVIPLFTIRYRPPIGYYGKRSRRCFNCQVDGRSMSSENTTIWVQRWLNELANADSAGGMQARNALIEHSRRRMEALCRKSFFGSLDGSPVQWDDVYQEAALRLWKSLESLKPATVREFFAIASLQIRRVLLDMYRKYKKAPPQFNGPDGQSTFDPVKLAVWEEFHSKVESLAEPQREIFDLLWYQGLTQNEAAEILGLDLSTVKRRWRKVRELLFAHLP